MLHKHISDFHKSGSAKCKVSNKCRRKIAGKNRTVCNFQSIKSPVELNSLFLKFFSYNTCFLYHLIRRDGGRLANESFTSNPIVPLRE